MLSETITVSTTTSRVATSTTKGHYYMDTELKMLGLLVMWFGGVLTGCAIGRVGTRWNLRR